MSTTLTLKPQVPGSALPQAAQSTTEDLPQAAPPEQPAATGFAALLGKRCWVKTVHGDMLHLFTNVWLTTDPKKIEVDQFVVNQLEASKMALHVEEE